MISTALETVHTIPVALLNHPSPARRPGPLAGEVYPVEFAALRDELDRVLERADGRLEDLARDWWEPASHRRADPGASQRAGEGQISASTKDGK